MQQWTPLHGSLAVHAAAAAAGSRPAQPSNPMPRCDIHLLQAEPAVGPGGFVSAGGMLPHSGGVHALLLAAPRGCVCCLAWRRHPGGLMVASRGRCMRGCPPRPHARRSACPWQPMCHVRRTSLPARLTSLAPAPRLERRRAVGGAAPGGAAEPHVPPHLWGPHLGLQRADCAGVSHCCLPHLCLWPWL